MSTKVIHMREAPSGWEKDSNYVYIGRPCKWGNPFSEKKYGREKCIEMFRRKFSTQPQLLKDITNGELVDKILVCYCKPQACHGDVLVEFTNKLAGRWTRIQVEEEKDQLRTQLADIITAWDSFDDGQGWSGRVADAIDAART